MAPSRKFRLDSLPTTAVARASARCVRGLLRALWVAILLGASPANAFIDPIVIVPARPVAGQPIAFSVRIGVCEYLQAFGPVSGGTLFATDEWRTIGATGNSLQVTVRALYAPDESGCVYPTGTFQFSLGTLTPGAYRLELYGQAISDPAFRPLIGTAQFVVGAPAAPVPVNRWGALFVLLVVLAATGTTRLRRLPAS